jgi:hypothetical protein
MKGLIGDEVDAILAAAGPSLRKLLRGFFLRSFSSSHGSSGGRLALSVTPIR